VATKVASGEAEFSVNNQPAKDGLEEMAEAAEKAAERMTAADARAARAAEKEAAKVARAAEREAARAAKAVEREAAKAAKAVEREAARKIKAEEKAAAAAAKAAEKASGGWMQAAKNLQSNQLVSDAEQVASLFIQVGGSVSRVASVVTSAIRPVALLGTTLGPMGLAAAGAAASLAGIPLVAVGVFKALDGITSSAAEANERLEKLGQHVEDTGGLVEYTRAVQALDMSLDKAAVTLGSGLGHEMAVFLTFLGQTAEDFAENAKYAYAFTQGLADILTFGIEPLVHGLEVDLYRAMTRGSEATVAANTALANYDAQLKLTAATIAAAAKNNEQVAQEDEAEGKRQQELADEAERRRKAASAAHKAYVRDLQQAVEQGNKAMAEAAAARRTWFEHDQEMHEEMRKGSLAFDENVSDLERLSEAAELAGFQIENMITQGTVQNQKERIKEIAEAAIDLAGQFGSTIGSILGDLQALSDQRIADLQEAAEAEVSAAVDQAERWADGENKLIDMMEERGRLSEQEAAAERKRVNDDLAAKKKAANELAADERKAAMEAFRRGQSLAGTQATIAAAVSALALIPSLAYLGWGAPFAAAGLAGAALATQIAVINAQDPPEFPMGLRATSPDHPRIVAVQNGEPVLPQRAVDLLGGPKAVDRLIAGQRPGDAAGMGAVNVYLGRRLLAQAIEETTPSKPLDPRTGRRDPWRRP
jgi:hypothetical protein